MSEELEPLITGRIKNQVHAILGEVLRHQDELGASHGCVEVTNARRQLEILTAERFAFREDLDRFRFLVERMNRNELEILGDIDDMGYARKYIDSLMMKGK